MRASGARTRSEALGVRDASAQPHRTPVTEGAVVVRPMTSVEETAAILMRVPPGKRVVHLAGFAGDITAYGDSRAAGSAATVHVSNEIDSGIERGIERVRDRVLHRMRALRSSGARIDAFTVEYPASLPPGPFGESVLAEAVDSAVLEVFPRAQAPDRGGDVREADPAAEDASGDAANVDAEIAEVPSPAVASSQNARPGASAPAASRAPAPPAEVPHMETAFEERGIQWDRIIDDTREGAQFASSRRSR